jgi:hypothetical protein
MDSHFHEPVSDRGQDFSVRLIGVIKSRRINENEGMVVIGMRSLDGLNFGRARFPATANGMVVLASSMLDEL